MSSIADIERDLTDAEQRHAEALRRWNSMPASHADFIALGNALPKLEAKIATLRQRRASVEYGAGEPEPAPPVPKPAERKFDLAGFLQGVVDAYEKLADEAENEKEKHIREAVRDRARKWLDSVDGGLPVEGHIVLFMLISAAMSDFKMREAADAPALKFAGLWTDGASYREGSVVTYGGSAWVALQSNRAGKGLNEPGLGDGVWKLFAKRGRDGLKSDTVAIRKAVLAELADLARRSGESST